MDGTGSAGAGTSTETSTGANAASAAASNSSTSGADNPNVNTGTGNNQAGNNAGNQHNNSGDTASIERMIQSAVDRATQKLGTENKELKERIDQLTTLNMTDAEKHEHDMLEREKALKAGEAALKMEKNKMYAIGAIKKAGLDNGTDIALNLIDLVMAEDEKTINTRVENLSTFVKQFVTAEVNKTFAANGRQPGKSNESDSKSDKNTAAINVGKRAAAASKASQGILDYYTGGKK